MGKLANIGGSGKVSLSKWCLNGELHLRLESDEEARGRRMTFQEKKDNISDGSGPGRSLTSSVTADPKLQWREITPGVYRTQLGASLQVQTLCKTSYIKF